MESVFDKSPSGERMNAENQDDRLVNDEVQALAEELGVDLDGEM